MMRKVRKNQGLHLVEKARNELKYMRFLLMLLMLLLILAQTASAAGDPLASIDALSDFIFSAIKAIGMILLGFGIVQIGLSLKSHDAQQRANGFLTFFGGIVIAFAKDILDMIM